MIMQTPQKTIEAQAFQPHDELILVIKRTDLFASDEWQGLKKVDYAAYAHLIQEKQEFLPRSLMEQDFAYKQIIPYLVFKHENKYFLMQRQAKATETRLKNKFSLGIGGHINKEDLVGNDIAAWARREFHEEVDYAGALSITPIGILNDDSNPVGQVHVGFVFLLEGEHAQISVKEELKSGQLLTLEECAPFYDQMETWTQIVYNFFENFITTLARA